MKALDGVVRIRLKIHLVRLSGDYGHSEITKRLGKLKPVSPDQMSQYGKVDGYEEMAYHNHAGHRLTLHYEPTEGFKPYYYIVVLRSNQVFLELKKQA